MSEEVPLREYLEQRDDALEKRFDAFEKENAADHSRVMSEFAEFRNEMRTELAEIKREINSKLSGVVTWPSLGFALVMAGGLYALADRF